MTKKLLTVGMVVGMMLALSVTAFAGGHHGGGRTKHYYGDGHSYCNNNHYYGDGHNWHTWGGHH